MKLQARPCDKFVGEDLLYFFVGRPAFKNVTEAEASAWECPVVFVFRELGSISAIRIHPFDTGSYIEKRLPSYIRAFTLDRFDLGKKLEIVWRLIEAFFGDVASYLDGIPYGEREFKRSHNLTPEHQEIEALMRLYNDKAVAFDDRGKCVEVQVDRDFEIASENLIGIVLPAPYAQHTRLMEKLKDLGCKLETYRIYPVKVEAYYQMIYDKVRTMLEEDRR